MIFVGLTGLCPWHLRSLRKVHVLRGAPPVSWIPKMGTSAARPWKDSKKVPKIWMFFLWVCLFSRANLLLVSASVHENIANGSSFERFWDVMDASFVDLLLRDWKYIFPHNASHGFLLLGVLLWVNVEVGSRFHQLSSSHVYSDHRIQQLYVWGNMRKLHFLLGRNKKVWTFATC